MRIFLLGFMGTGKTYWGRKWSTLHDIPFYDLDEHVERQEQATVADIFEKNGEDYFRQKEAIMLRSLALNEPAIISCGGGTPCFFDNMDFMNENGITVLLDASPAYILENVKNEPGKRPLINDLNEAELLFFIEQKIKERIPYYSRAKLILSAPELEPGSFERIVHTINW